MPALQFELTHEEANLILSALARQPYSEVFQLIHKLQEQAQSQPEDKED